MGNPELSDQESRYYQDAGIVLQACLGDATNMGCIGPILVQVQFFHAYPDLELIFDCAMKFFQLYHDLPTFQVLSGDITDVGAAKGMQSAQLGGMVEVVRGWYEHPKVNEGLVRDIVRQAQKDHARLELSYQLEVDPANLQKALDQANQRVGIDPFDRPPEENPFIGSERGHRQ